MRHASNLATVSVVAFATTLGTAGTGHAADLCFLPRDATGRNVTADCSSSPDVWPNDWIGFSTSGTACMSLTSPLICWPLPTTSLRYTWTLSASDTDPYVNVVDLPATATLYLWIVCAQHGDFDHVDGEGVAGVEFGVGGDITVVSFVPWEGFLNVDLGDPTQILMAAAGCPTEQVVAGEFHVTVPTPVDATSWGRIKSVYR